MKKFSALLFTLTILSAVCATALCSCAKKVDYYSYVSEYRHHLYIYEDDSVSLKIYISDKETPFMSDGIKGSMSSVCEVYYTPKDVPDEVIIDLNGLGGEMNYLSTTRNFYLSFNCDKPFGAKVCAILETDGVKREIEVGNVCEEGTIDGKTALKCVVEYDGEQFDKLTEGNAFRGEIGIRILYDEGCYYYVGVCDKNGNTHAYLLDASDGRIIAERDIDS